MAGAGTMAKSPDASPPVSTPATAQDDHVPPSRGSNGLGTWVDVSADFGSFDAYRQAAGFDADDIAISTGIDRRLGEYGLLGLSLGYNRDRSAIGNDGTRSTARGYSAALYGSFAPSAKTYIDAILGGGGLSFDSRRRASNSDSYLFGQRNGRQWFGSVTAGYEYRHAHWLLSPYGRLQWSYSDLDSFAESGDVIDALAYGRQSVRTSVAVLGVRSSWMVMQGETVLIPRVRLEVGHNFQGASNTTLNYAFVPSAGSWNVLTNPYTANGNSVLADLGLDIQLPHGTTLTTDYNFLAQPHSRNQLIRLGVQTKF
jgi:outer membrane autotransporter protein